MNSLDSVATQLQEEFSAEVVEDVSPPIATPKESTGVKTIQLFSTEEKKEPATSTYLATVHELIKPIQKAITQQGLASISKDILGPFLNSFPIDSSWELEELFETGLTFYVLKNQSSEAYVRDVIRQACESSNSEVISIPAITPMTLRIEEFEFETHALTFTRKDLQYIQLPFIKSIGFQYNEESIMDACYVITIDRTKLA